MNEVVALNMANPESADKVGSIAALVSGKEGISRYFLTCSHVALGGKADDLNGPLSTPRTVSILERGKRIDSGQLVYARLNTLYDVALVKIAPPLNSRKNGLPDGRAFKNPIDRSLLKVNQKLGFYSTLTREIVWGRVTEPNTARTITLSYGFQKKKFTNLLVFGAQSAGKPVSQAGDSGSLLFTEDLRPVGLVIGGGTKEDYAIALTEVLDLTHTKFILPS